MKEKTYKMWAPELTLDLKEIILNNEWYYKITHPKRTDFLLYILYVFAIVWLYHTIMFYYFNFIK